MSKTYGNAGIPVDEPIVTRPGIKFREADMFANPKYVTVSPEHPENVKGGDLGNLIMPGFESRPLTHPGKPFSLKPGRGGK